MGTFAYHWAANPAFLKKNGKIVWLFDHSDNWLDDVADALTVSAS